jgi:hypothetical protein
MTISIINARRAIRRRIKQIHIITSTVMAYKGTHTHTPVCFSYIIQEANLKDRIYNWIITHSAVLNASRAR